MNSASSYWYATLGEVREQIQKISLSPHQRDLLSKKVVDLFNDPLFTMHSGDPLESAQETFDEVSVDFILVQDSPGTLAGIIQREVVAEALEVPSIAKTPQLVGRCMDRNICIEPETATVLEVLDRMTVGFCRCALIVDHLRGFPLFIISPAMIYQHLQDVLDLPGVAARTGNVANHTAGSRIH